MAVEEKVEEGTAAANVEAKVVVATAAVKGEVRTEVIQEALVVVGVMAVVDSAVQEAAALAWSDDAHVQENRRKYGEKFAAAETLFKGRYDFYRPAGGFFLWLNVGNSEAAARHLWATQGLRVLPGTYLAREDASGDNPASAYIRVALVDEQETMTVALKRLKDGLDSFNPATVGAD